MTTLLERAFEEVSRLSEIEQDDIAREILALIEQENAFDALIAAHPEVAERLFEESQLDGPEVRDLLPEEL